VVLVLGQQRVFVLAIDDALPQRADQMQESAGFDHLPAVGFEFVRGLAGHVVISVGLAGCHAVGVISSVARVL
jgi:hypothetical protein